MAYHSSEDIGPITIPEWEEHGHIGGDDQYPPYKSTFAPPVAYKCFPSSASGYTYHCIGPVGAASGASVWRVLREEKATGTLLWAGGSASWTKALVDVTSLSYS